MSAINVAKCVAYLRRIGLDISETTRGEWLAHEANERTRRRAHNRELKKSCGHFRTHDCRVVSQGSDVVITYCNDCHRAVSQRPNAPRGPSGGGGEPLPAREVA